MLLHMLQKPSNTKQLSKIRFPLSCILATIPFPEGHIGCHIHRWKSCRPIHFYYDSQTRLKACVQQHIIYGVTSARLNKLIREKEGAFSASFWLPRKACAYRIWVLNTIILLTKLILSCLFSPGGQTRSAFRFSILELLCRFHWGGIRTRL